MSEVDRTDQTVDIEKSKQYLVGMYEHNIRQEPNLKSVVIQSLKAGDIITVARHHDLEWGEVADGGFIRMVNLKEVTS
jgi:uncharacterized protein YgiM (DUF1202 family)